MIGAEEFQRGEALPGNLVIISQIDSFQGYFNYLCAGELLCGNKVVTTAHGVRNSNLSNLWVLRKSNEEEKSSWRILPITSMLVSDALDKSDPCHDIAVLTLDVEPEADIASINYESGEPESDICILGWSESAEGLSPHSLHLKPLTKSDLLGLTVPEFLKNSEDFIVAKSDIPGLEVSKGNSGAPAFTKNDQGANSHVGFVSYEYIDEANDGSLFILSRSKSAFDLLQDQAQDIPEGFRREAWVTKDRVTLLESVTGSSESQYPLLSYDSTIPIIKPGEYQIELTERNQFKNKPGLYAIHFGLIGDLVPGSIVEISCPNAESSGIQIDVVAYSLPDHQWIGRGVQERSGKIYLGLQDCPGSVLITTRVIKDGAPPEFPTKLLFTWQVHPQSKTH